MSEEKAEKKPSKLEAEIDEKFKGLLPMSPGEGPPLPRILKLKWPWVKK